MSLALVLPLFGLAATVEELLTLLKDRSPKVRVQAAVLLGKSGNPTAVDPLCAVVGADENDAVRTAAAGALGLLADGRAKKTLTDAAVNDPSRLVRDAAKKSLELLASAAPTASGAGPAVAIDTLGGKVQGPLGEAFRAALRAELGRLGFDMIASGKTDAELRAELGRLKKPAFAVKPAVLALGVEEAGGKTVLTCKVSGMAVDPGGRVATMSEANTKMTIGATRLPELDRATYQQKLLEAAAKNLAAELKTRL